MSNNDLAQAFHTERSIAARSGILRYRCACKRCHGLKEQLVEVVERHHRTHGRDVHLRQPLLRMTKDDHTRQEDVADRGGMIGETHEEHVPNGVGMTDDTDEDMHNEDYEEFQEDVHNTAVDFEAMIEKFFLELTKSMTR